MRIAPPIGDSIEALGHSLRQVIDVLNGQLGFGAPISADAPTAGDQAVDNLEGSWVTKVFDTLDAVETCTHNLDVPVNSAGTPNVRWLLFGIEHDGNSATSASAVSISYETGDTVAVNEIDLRAYSSSGRVVDGDHPLTVTLFFTRAES